MQRHMLNTPAACLVIACVMTALAGLEHGFAPWRPLYLVYAALCIALPLYARSVPFTWPRLGLVRWVALLVSVFAAQLLLRLFFASVWPALLLAGGVASESIATAQWQIGAALGTAIGRYAGHWDLSPGAMLAVYFGFITLWAGVGEELFYRGFVHENLRAIGLWQATLLNSFLFAIRHAVQLQGPDYPWGAAAGWVAMSFALGVFFTLLYEWRRSIWPPVVAHVLFNLIPAAQSLLAR